MTIIAQKYFILLLLLLVTNSYIKTPLKIANLPEKLNSSTVFDDSLNAVSTKISKGSYYYLDFQIGEPPKSISLLISTLSS